VTATASTGTILRGLFESRRKFFWIGAVLALVLDQVTKALLWHPPGAAAGPVVLIPRLLQLVSHPGNTKGALGLGPDAPWFYVVAALVVMPLVLYFLLTTPARNGLVACGLGLLAGGAVGNLIDRVSLRYVRDFIDLHWGEAFHWHTFNVADAAICTGFGLIVLDMVLPRKAGASARPEGEAPEECEAAGRSA